MGPPPKTSRHFAPCDRPRNVPRWASSDPKSLGKAKVWRPRPPDGAMGRSFFPIFAAWKNGLIWMPKNQTRPKPWSGFPDGETDAGRSAMFRRESPALFLQTFPNLKTRRLGVPRG